MTKEEALRELGNISLDYEDRNAEEIARLDAALEMAIEALVKIEERELTPKYTKFGKSIPIRLEDLGDV